MMARAALWRSLVLLALLAGLPAPLTAQDAGADPAPAATTPAPDGAAPVAPQTGTITGVVPAPSSAVTTAPGLTKTQTAGTRSGTKSISLTPSDQQTVDYAAWEAIATRAERATAETQTSTNGLELLRGQLVDWRGKLQAARHRRPPLQRPRWACGPTKSWPRWRSWPTSRPRASSPRKSSTPRRQSC